MTSKAQLPLLLSKKSAGISTAQDIRLSEESPRILKGFGPSNLLIDQVPDFINRDHSSFREFLEAYYEWMERYENPFGMIDSFLDNTDVDRTVGIFFSDFRENYLRNFPYQLAVDELGNIVSEKNFIKNARKFYGSKGTEKSFKFLFRLIFDVHSEVSYPGKNILKTSDGIWLERMSLKATSNGGTANYKMAGNRVYQVDSTSGNLNAYAQVVDVIQYSKNYFSVTEMFITNKFGTFTPGNLVYVDLLDGTRLQETLYPVVTSCKVNDGGMGYSTRDRIDASNMSDGIGLVLSIGIVKANSGKIIDVVVEDSGVGYSFPPTISVTSNSGNGKAVLTAEVGALTRYPGYYKNNNGKLSSTKRLYDANFYQEFSYLLSSEISRKNYAELYKKLVHPAGFKMFSNILINRNIIDSIPFHSEAQRYELPFIGHYTPYRFGTTYDLQPKYPSGFNPRGTTYSSDQNYGQSGGRLLVKPVGFSFDSSTNWTRITATGAANNGISAAVFEFRPIGETYGVLLLKQIDFDVAVAGYTGAGFVEGATFRMFAGTTGYTATIDRVLFGTGIVVESGGATHHAEGKPLGSSLGAEGYIEARGLSYEYWSIYHHPNTRGIFGLTGIGNGLCGAGASFGAVALKPFMKMPIGYHFHSNPNGGPYEGTTGSDNEYGLIESTDLTSPNF